MCAKSGNRTHWSLCLLWAVLWLVSSAASKTKSSVDLTSFELKLQSYHFELHETSRFHTHPSIELKSILSAPSKAWLQHEVVFAIRQQNLLQLERTLLEVSTPSHRSYGQHWNRQQIAELTSNPTATNAITTFLTDLGFEVTSTTKFGEYITAKASIAMWEALFQTTFQEFYDKDSNLHLIRALNYSLPRELKEHLVGVFGVSDYSPFKKKVNPANKLMKNTYATVDATEMLLAAKHNGDIFYGNGGAPWCHEFTDDLDHPLFLRCVVYPQLLYSYYNSSSPYGNANATQAVFGSLDQSFSPDDLTKFQNDFGLLVKPIAGSYNGHVYYNACSVTTDDCDEASLDVQYITSMAQLVPTYYDYYALGDGQTFVTWITSIADMEDPADLFSISYGTSEIYQSDTMLTSFNIEAQKLGIMGVSMIVSSGDDGAVDGDASGNAQYCKYQPDFPCVSPYITCVGATQGPEYDTPEVTCQIPNSPITSGGGFSARPSINGIPSWQQAQVNQYFTALNANNQSLYPGYGSGRGYPDVSLLGNDYSVIMNATLEFVSGTSASAPAFAGIVSQANSMRKQAGMPALGFLNPLIYGNASLFAHDITAGNNTCTSAYNVTISQNRIYYIGTCCPQGYLASIGWDPVTGIGSVDVTKFLSVVQSTVSSAPTLSPATPPSPPTLEPSIQPFIQTMAPTIITGQVVSYSVVSGVSGGGFKSIASDYSGENLIAVNNSKLSFSSKGSDGMNWNQSVLASNADLAVAVTSDHTGNYLFIAANQGYISSNGGVSWHNSSTSFRFNLQYAASSKMGNVVLTADYSNIYKSTDYGNHFNLSTSIPSSNQASIQSIAVDATGQYLAFGMVRDGVNVSSDGGKTWMASQGLPIGSNIWYQHLIRSASNVIVANDTSVHYSTDGGMTFQLAKPNLLPSSIDSMCASEDLKYAIIRTGGSFPYFGSRDYGQTWFVLTIGNPPTVFYDHGSYVYEDAMACNQNATKIFVAYNNGDIGILEIDWDVSFTQSAAPTISPTAKLSVSPTNSPPPTLSPTYVTTQTPTVVPTEQVYPVVTFTSSLSLSSLTTTTLTDADKTSIVQATASSMNISSNQVVFVSYTPSRRLRDTIAVQGSITYNITAVTQTSTLVYSGQTADSVYSTLTQSLTNAVEYGAFNTYLDQYATDNGATTVANAKANNVDNGPLEESQPNNNDDDDDDGGGLSTVEIAGVAVGGAVFVGILAFIIYWFAMKPKGGKSSGLASQAEDRNSVQLEIKG